MIRGLGRFAPGWDFSRLFGRLALLLALFLPSHGFAQDWSALKEPGAIALMRHALAPGTGDPSGFRVDDCTTQRNLDAQGRAQARVIGAALRAEGVAFDHILSSAWCRCQETAALLGLGPVEIAPALNSFFQRSEERAARTAAALELLAQLDGSALLVTHQVNITALTGVFPRSGEIVVIRVTDGGIEVRERLLIDP